MSNTSLEKIGCFNTILDPYNGITIESKDLPLNKEEFETNLDLLIENVKNRRFLIIYDILNYVKTIKKEIKYEKEYLRKKSKNCK